ncbi:MAG: hypothetical protein HOQ10_13475 [Frateuria sp.]|nr:hypothetical protein [Frateuria sp.]
MSQFDVAVLLAAISAAFIWSACFSHLSGDTRRDVTFIGATGALLGAGAALMFAW